MIQIEFREPKFGKCDCCGQETVQLTRFVQQDEKEFAVYYINFTKGHSSKVACGLIGLGEWGDDSEPKDRLDFPFEIWSDDSQYHVGLIEAEESPWSHVTFLGRILNRSEALNHKWSKDVFYITNHILSEDKIVIDYFTEIDE